MKDFSAFLDRRFKNWAHKICSQKYLPEDLCLPFYSPACLISALHPKLLSGVLKIAAAAAHDLVSVEVDGKCQSVVDKG